jgi:hypothetical protein
LTGARSYSLSAIWPTWKLPVVVIASYFVLNLICIGVGGNFPLNDDWMYGLEVKRLIETGQLHLLGGSPACAVHVILGALVCKLFGFSFVVLRWLCITLSFVGCLLLFAVLRELGARRSEALCGATLLATNPLYVNLTFGYMTDVPALTYILTYALLYLRAIRTGNAAVYILAGLALMLAIATRQNMAVFIACNAIISLMLWFRKRSGALLSAIFLVCTPAACAYFVDHLMSVVNEFPAAYDWYKEEIARLLRLAVSKPFAFCFLETVSTVRTAAYLGLFTCPLLASMLVPRAWLKPGGPRAPDALVIRRETAIYMCIALLLTMCGVTFLLEFKHELMPFSPNLCLFPILGSFDIIAIREHRNPAVQIALTAGAATFACILLFAAICSTHRTALLLQRAFLKPSSRAREPRAHTTSNLARRAISCSLVIGLALASCASAVFHTTIANLDRYYLVPLTMIVPCCMLAIRWLRMQISPAFAIVAIGTMALYSTIAEHDYLSWSRARWQALSDLTQEGINANEIDGGAEFNYANDPALSNDLQLGPSEFKFVHRGSSETAPLRGWNIHGERFIISMRPINGYRVRSQYNFQSFLMGSNRQLFVLEAEPDSHTSR